MNNTSRRIFGGLLTAMLFLLVGCGGEGSSVTQEKPVCQAPEGQVLSDIQSVVDWINAMEKPLSLPCFVASLPRPLRTHSSLSNFSAQPAIGRRSPRIIFFVNDLMLTVAIDQDDIQDVPVELEPHLLEMGHFLEDIVLEGAGLEDAALESSIPVSIKGEVKFPILEAIPDSEPYSGILFNETATTCIFCHGGETQHAEIDGFPILRSEVLRPVRTLPLYELTNESLLCDPEAEPHRCAMLESIVGHGDLEQQAFPAGARNVLEPFGT